MAFRPCSQSRRVSGAQLILVAIDVLAAHGDVRSLAWSYTNRTARSRTLEETGFALA